MRIKNMSGVMPAGRRILWGDIYHLERCGGNVGGYIWD